MPFSIKGERTRPTTRLCDTCHYARIFKGPQQGQEVVMCNFYSDYKGIPFPVVECSYYLTRGALTEYDAQQLGWVLEVRKGEPAGFRPPKKFEGLE